MENIVSYAPQAVKYQKKIVFNAGIESSINYLEPTTAYSPQVSLLFSPFGLPFVPIEILSTNLQKIIQSMTWNKDRNNPGGALAVTVTPDDSVIMEMFNVIKNLPGGSMFAKIWESMGFNIEDLFKPMTLCQLWVDGYHVMTGTVRACVRHSAVSNKGYACAYTITIDELGHLYSRSTARLDTIILDGLKTNLIDSMTSSMTAVTNLTGAPISMVIAAYCAAFKATTLLNQGMNMSDGFPLAYRMLSTISPLGGLAIKPIASSMIASSNMFDLNGGQSFWDFLKNMIPNPWMEFFTESGGRTMVTDAIAPPAVLFPGFNYVVSRSVPYSNPLLGIVNPAHFIGGDASIFLTDLSALQLLVGGDFVIITDEEVHSKSLGFDGSNQATSFRTSYSGGGSTKSPDFSQKPIYSPGPLNPFASGGMGTFGLSEMVEDMNLCNLYDFGTAVDSVLGDIAKATLGGPGIYSQGVLSNLLAVWFRNQSRFREGTITTRMKPWARPGMYCLYLPIYSGKHKPENVRDIGMYYIDSLSHSYELDDKEVSATTTFNLIRGVPLPTTLAQAALQLFDWEILPPVSGLWDGEFKALQLARKLTSLI